jgi:hypothetical protein
MLHDLKSIDELYPTDRTNLVHIAYYKGLRWHNKNADFFDHIICLFTFSRYSHTELLLNYDPMTGIADAYSATHRAGGIRTKKINVHTNSWIVLPYYTKHPKEEIKNWFDERIGSKYDWLGVLGFYFPFPIHKKSRWFCSEAVAESLGLEDPHQYTPGDLYKHNREV